MGICVSNELALTAAPNGANLSVNSSSPNPSGAVLSPHQPHSDRDHHNNDRNHLELEDSFTAAARRPSLSSPPPLALPRFTVDANRPPMVLHRDGREASRPHPAPPQPHERGDQTASTAAVTVPRSVSLQDLSPDHNGARLSSHPAPPLPHHTGRSPLKRQNSSSRSRSHKRHAKNPLQQQQQQQQSGTMGSAPFSPTLTRENDSCSFGHPPTPHPPQQDALQMSVTTTTTTTSSVSSEPTQRRRLPPRSRSFEQLQLQQQQLELDSRLPPIHNQPGGGGSPSFQRLPRPPSAAQQYPSGSMQQQLSHDSSMQYSGSQQIEQPGSPFRPRPPPAGDPQQQHHHHPQQRHHHHLVQQQSSSVNMLSFSKLPANSHPSVVQPPTAVGLGGGGGAVLTTTPLQHPAPPHTWYHPSPNLSHQNNNSEGYSYDENVSSPLTGTFPIPNREINNASFPTTNVRLEGTTTTTTNSSTTLTQHQMNPPLLNHPQPAGVVVPSSSPSSPRPPHSKLLRSPHQGVGKAKLSPLTVAMPDAGSFVTTLDPPSTPLLKGVQPLAPPPSSGRRVRPASYSNTTLHNVPPPIVHWMRYDPPLPSSTSHSNTVTTTLSPSHRALFGSDDPLAASANQNAASSALLLLNPNWTAGGTVPVNGSSVPPPTMSPGCFSLAVYQEEGRSWLLEPTQQPQQGRSPQSQAVSSSNKIIVPQQQQMLPKEEPPLPRHMSSLCFAGANGQSLSDQESAGAISPSVLPLIQYCAFGES